MRTLLPFVILGTIGTIGTPAEAADEQSLPAVQVSETRSFAEQNQLPQTTASITGAQTAETITVMGAEDALKYLPDVRGTVAATCQGFESFFVMDARVHCQLDKRWSGALGVDNLNNHKHFLFRPFPQRTFYLSLKYTL